MRRAVTVLAAILFACSPAFAQPNDVDLARRINELSEFVRVATGYEVKTLPKISFQPPENVNRLFFRENYDGQDVIEAMTFGNVIFLRSDFQLGRDDDILVHELVHFMQFESGKDREVPCTQALEPEAYHVQDIFNAARANERRSDAFTVFVISQCER